MRVNELSFNLFFISSVTSSFAELRDESDLLDATVICEGQTVRAHKLVLSACSGVFRQLFRSSASALSNGNGPMMNNYTVSHEINSFYLCLKPCFSHYVYYWTTYLRFLQRHVSGRMNMVFRLPSEML